jgi:large subunit ribosomal protein L29
MKAADLREKSADDLGELRQSLAHEVFQNRLKNFTNRLDDTSAIRKTKRDLARVLTLLRERRDPAEAVPAVGEHHGEPETSADVQAPLAAPPSAETAQKQRAADAAAGAPVKTTAKKSEAKR